MSTEWGNHRKYNPKNWTTTGQNKFRRLKNIKFSLNEEDYQAPEDYEFDLLLVEVISKALEDLARFPTGHPTFKDAKKFIYSQDLDMWCIAFGRNIDTTRIRQKADDLIKIPEKRNEYLRFCHDKATGRYRKGGKKDGGSDYQELPADGVSSEGDTEL